jgi:hypothetical protein
MKPVTGNAWVVNSISVMPACAITAQRQRQQRATTDR